MLQNNYKWQQNKLRERHKNWILDRDKDSEVFCVQTFELTDGNT